MHYDLPHDRPLTVTKIAYDPRTYDPNDTDSKPKPHTSAGSVLVEFDDLIDPELVVTVGGTPLKRVRDWRGRATPVSATDTISVNGQKVGHDGLLEADTYDIDTWMSPNPHTVLINLSTDLAGSLAGVMAFPPIRLHNGSGEATDLQGVLQNWQTTLKELRVGGIKYASPPFSTSALLPLLYAQSRKPVNFRLGLSSNSTLLYAKDKSRERECISTEMPKLENDYAKLKSPPDWQQFVASDLEVQCKTSYAEGEASSNAAVRVAAFDAVSGEQIALNTTVNLILQANKDSSRFFSFPCAQLNSLELTCPITWSNYYFLDPQYQDMSGRVIAPGIGEGSDNINLLAPPDVTLTLNDLLTTSSSWVLSLHTQNLREVTGAAFSKLDLRRTSDVASAANIVTNTSVAQNGDLNLSIPFTSFSIISNRLFLTPASGPTVSQIPVSNAIPISNLRDALSPVVSSIEGEHGQILRGSMLGSVSKVVAGNATCTDSVAESVQPSDTSLELPAIRSEGLLKFCIGNYPVPAMYAPEDGTKPAQLYGSLKGTGEAKQFYLAGHEPTTPPSAQNAANPKQTKTTSQPASATSSPVDAQATITLGNKSVTATLKGADLAAATTSGSKPADSVTVTPAPSTPPATTTVPSSGKPQTPTAATLNVDSKKYKRPIVTSDIGNQQTPPQ
jgi:hypothetical protein